MEKLEAGKRKRGSLFPNEYREIFVWVHKRSSFLCIFIHMYCSSLSFFIFFIKIPICMSLWGYIFFSFSTVALFFLLRLQRKSDVQPFLSIFTEQYFTLQFIRFSSMSLVHSCHWIFLLDFLPLLLLCV